MKKDKARQWTDKELEKMERNLKRHYKQATDELTAKWNKYMERARERISGLQAKYDTALKGGDQNSIREAKERLEKAKRSATLENERYKNMVDETTEKLAHVNEGAVAYMNGKMSQAYAVNYNQAKDAAKDIGVKFNLVDGHTIGRLAATGDIKLPKKKVNIPKDMRWNTKQLNSSVLQGILQGESMDKIAKRILPIVDNNRQAAIRNARTMVTGAENVGRLDSYRRLQENGAILKKVWIATHDSRVRAWHLDMDGQEADIDDMFIDGNGNELAYPADPSAAGETVYNCRCSMTTRIVGFKKPKNQPEENNKSAEQSNEEAGNSDLGYGKNANGHYYTKAEYEKRLKELNKYDNYHYHATTTSSISGIKSKGLLPNRGHAGEEVYMAKTEKSALTWTESTSTGGDVVIRVKNTYLAKTDYMDYDETEWGEGSIGDTIPSKMLEVRGYDGEWIPIEKAIVSYMRGVARIIRKP